MGAAKMIFLLIAGHALADYPLQGDFLAKAKNFTTPIPGVPWWQAMAAHASIHGGMVFVITGSLTCAAIEVMAHYLIDCAKVAGRIGFNTDQALHVACKAGYVIAIGAAA